MVPFENRSSRSRSTGAMTGALKLSRGTLEFQPQSLAFLKQGNKFLLIHGVVNGHHRPLSPEGEEDSLSCIGWVTASIDK
jgi:hypothetical protein